MVKNVKRFFWILVLTGSVVFSRPDSLWATALPEPVLPVKENNQRTGAATLDELSAALFAAIKSDDFAQLRSFFPTQAELEIVQNGRDKNLQAITEKLTYEQIRSNFKNDFETMMQTATSRMLNWTEMNLAETTPNRLRSPQTTLAPVKMFLSAGEHKAQHYIIYEAIKIRNRYYLFQHISLEKSS